MKTNQRGADVKTDSHWDTGIAKTDSHWYIGIAKTDRHWDTGIAKTDSHWDIGIAKTDRHWDTGIAKTDSHWDTGIAKTMTPMPNDRGNKSIKYHTNRPLNLILAHTLQLSVILLGTTDNINKSALTDIYIYIIQLDYIALQPNVKHPNSDLIDYGPVLFYINLTYNDV